MLSMVDKRSSRPLVNLFTTQHFPIPASQSSSQLGRSSPFGGGAEGGGGCTCRTRDHLTSEHALLGNLYAYQNDG